MDDIDDVESADGEGVIDVPPEVVAEVQAALDDEALRWVDAAEKELAKSPDADESEEAEGDFNDWADAQVEAE